MMISARDMFNTVTGGADVMVFEDGEGMLVTSALMDVDTGAMWFGADTMDGAREFDVPASMIDDPMFATDSDE